jgi:hypothetical protein
MRLLLVAALVAVLGLVVIAAEGPAHPAPVAPVAPAEPAGAGGLRAVPTEREETLRERRLHVVVVSKDGGKVAGLLESYSPGKENRPGAFVLTAENGKPQAIWDVDVARIEVVKPEPGEPIREPRIIHNDVITELQDALRTGKGPQYLEKHEAALQKAGTFVEGRKEFFAVGIGYRQLLSLEGKPLKDRLQAEVNKVENQWIRWDLQRRLQEDKLPWLKPRQGGKPPGPGRGAAPAPGAAREPEKL